MNPVKIVSLVTAALLLIGAFLIGGGAPLSPGELLDATRMAARNSKAAAENTAEAERSTRALVEIADNVRSQLESSEQLLQIQLGLEESSREGASRAKGLEGDIVAIGAALRDLQKAAESLSSASGDAGAQVEVLAGSATDLETSLAELEARFDEVVRQSRELNRKAEGFEQIRDLPR